MANGPTVRDVEELPVPEPYSNPEEGSSSSLYIVEDRDGNSVEYSLDEVVSDEELHPLIDKVTNGEWHTIRYGDKDNIYVDVKNPSGENIRYQFQTGTSEEVIEKILSSHPASIIERGVTTSDDIQIPETPPGKIPESLPAQTPEPSDDSTLRSWGLENTLKVAPDVGASMGDVGKTVGDNIAQFGRGLHEVPAIIARGISMGQVARQKSEQDLYEYVSKSLRSLGAEVPFYTPAYGKMLQNTADNLLNMVEPKAPEGIVQEVSRAVGQIFGLGLVTALGGPVAGIAGTAGFSVGSSYESMKKKEEIEKEETDTVTMLSNIFVRSAIGAVDYIPISKVFSRFSKISNNYFPYSKSSFLSNLKRLGSGKTPTEGILLAVEGMAYEGFTEAGQQGLESLSDRYILGLEDALDNVGSEMMKAGVVGGLAGGFVSGVSAGVATAINNAKEKAEQHFAEEVTPQLKELFRDKPLPRFDPEGIISTRDKQPGVPPPTTPTELADEIVDTSKELVDDPASKEDETKVINFFDGDTKGKGTPMGTADKGSVSQAIKKNIELVNQQKFEETRGTGREDHRRWSLSSLIEKSRVKDLLLPDFIFASEIPFLKRGKKWIRARFDFGRYTKETFNERSKVQTRLFNLFNEGSKLTSDFSLSDIPEIMVKGLPEAYRKGKADLSNLFLDTLNKFIVFRSLNESVEVDEQSSRLKDHGKSLIAVNKEIENITESIKKQLSILAERNKEGKVVKKKYLQELKTLKPQREKAEKKSIRLFKIKIKENEAIIGKTNKEIKALESRIKRMRSKEEARKKKVKRFLSDRPYRPLLRDKDTPEGRKAKSEWEKELVKKEEEARDAIAKREKERQNKIAVVQRARDDSESLRSERVTLLQKIEEAKGKGEINVVERYESRTKAIEEELLNKRKSLADKRKKQKVLLESDIASAESRAGAGIYTKKDWERLNSIYNDKSEFSKILRKSVSELDKVIQGTRNELVNEIKKLGTDPRWGQYVDERFSKKYYLPQKIASQFKKALERGGGKEVHLGPTGVGIRYESWYRQAVGQKNQINTNSLQSLMLVLMAQRTDISKLRLLRSLKKEYNHPKAERIIQEWNTDPNLPPPEGYALYSGVPEDFFFGISAPNVLLRKFGEDVLNNLGIDLEVSQRVEAAQKVHQGAVMLIPAELDKALRSFREINYTNEIEAFKLYKIGIANWKIWQLLSPHRIAGYFLRNLVGDSEFVFIGQTKIFLKAPQAFSELQAFYFPKDPGKATASLDLTTWLEFGGEQGTPESVELSQQWGQTNPNDISNILQKIANVENNDKIIDKAKVITRLWHGYFRKAKKVSEGREMILRFTAYKYYLDNIRKNRGSPTDYGASNPREVDGLRTPEEKAYLMSNQLIGAYDQVGKVSQFAREFGVFPFISFQEVNMRRHFWLFANVASNPMASYKVGKLAGISLASAWRLAMAGKILLKIAAVYSGYSAWNYSMAPEDEEKLPHWDRVKAHLLIPMPGGRIVYFNRLGSWSEFVETAGINIDPRIGKDIIASIMDNREFPIKKNIERLISLNTFFEKVSGSRGPAVKAIPSWAKGRGYLHAFLSVIDPKLANLVRVLKGFPPESLQKIILGFMGMKSVDRNEAPYNNIRRLVYEYQKDVHHRIDRDIAPTPSEVSWMDIKEAFMHGDYSYAMGIMSKTADLMYVKEALENKDKGGALADPLTRSKFIKSFERHEAAWHPLNGIKDYKKERSQDLEDFKKWLDESDRSQIELAQEYYDKTIVNTTYTDLLKYIYSNDWKK